LGLNISAMPKSRQSLMKINIREWRKHRMLKLTIECDACKTSIDKKGEFKGKTLEELKRVMQDSGWTRTKSDSYIGPKCDALYTRIDGMKLGMDTGIISHDTSDENRDKKPSVEIIGDDSFTWGYQSRYCILGFKSASGKNSHEKKFHKDKYVAPLRGEARKTQIKKDNFGKRGGKGRPDPACQN